MREIDYSDQFRRMICDMHAGLESSPFYESYIAAHLGSAAGRLMMFSTMVIPEIEYHCGPLAGKRVLDFGCGTGASTAALAEMTESVAAFDVSEASINIAKQRLCEHDLQDRVDLFCAPDIDDVGGQIGTFDLVVALGVIEHLPLTIRGLRHRVLASIATKLKSGGYLFLGDTPNRLWPEDSHTTRLWWIPWSRPGSEWAFKRAVRKGRYLRTAHYSPGPLGLEEQGAWGATFWEIQRHLLGCGMTCVNRVDGHNRRLYYSWPRTTKAAIFEVFARSTVCKVFRAPITAFAPYLNNLVFVKSSS